MNQSINHVDGSMLVVIKLSHFFRKINHLEYFDDKSIDF